MSSSTGGHLHFKYFLNMVWSSELGIIMWSHQLRTGLKLGCDNTYKLKCLHRMFYGRFNRRFTEGLTGGTSFLQLIVDTWQADLKKSPLVIETIIFQNV